MTQFHPIIHPFPSNLALICFQWTFGRRKSELAKPVNQVKSGEKSLWHIISYAVWLYCRFNLSHRDIEDLLAERGITVSREAGRLWWIKMVK
jgi:transposase-like protein